MPEPTLKEALDNLFKDNPVKSNKSYKKIINELSKEDMISVKNIYKKYKNIYGWNLQGCCLVIADEIQSAIGGECVAGKITWNSGNCSITHWWVEKDGNIVDPMGDEFLSSEICTGRLEDHRDQNIFYNILPLYEKYRVYEL